MPALNPSQVARSIAKSLLVLRNVDPNGQLTVSDSLAAQWRNPSDVLSVLLLLGPEIVQKAIAQLTGRIVTPVAFSFGWVAFAASSILHIVSGGRLMPACDTPEPEVIGATSGHRRTTKTWVLGRLLRDLEYEIDKKMANEQEHIPPTHTTGKQVAQDVRNTGQAQRPWEALRVAVFEVDETHQHGVPSLDWVWLSGFIVIAIQLVISIIPWIIDGYWGAFMVTLLGNVLSLTGSSLPQWREEKWPCGRKGRKGGATVTLTRGNGSRYAALILGKSGFGLDLEIMARGTRTIRPSWLTRIVVGILAVLWIMLLLCAAGLKQSTWYLLGIGLLGSIQNLVSAGAVRKPSAHGLHLNDVRVIKDDSVAKVLKKVEEYQEFAGTSLLDVFFPGSMRVQDPDISFWTDALEKRFAVNDHGTRLDRLPPKASENPNSESGRSKAVTKMSEPGLYSCFY